MSDQDETPLDNAKKEAVRLLERRKRTAAQENVERARAVARQSKPISEEHHAKTREAQKRHWAQASGEADGEARPSQEPSNGTAEKTGL